MTETVREMVAIVKDSIDGSHLERLNELGHRLVNDPSLLEEFKEAPEKVAEREVDANLPDGVHLHFIDENDRYFPEEGSSYAQITKEASVDREWGRAEIRVGGGGGGKPKFCIGICGFCV